MTIDLDAFRALIRDELTQLDASLQQQAVSHDLRARLSTRKRRLGAALARADAGSFGSCCECGEALDTQRLQHDPATVFCADCAAERDNG